ncbi:2,5-dichloro-2,5-cyclohexadiene-1,4-diol dehydrogenase LinC [Hyphomonas neptunium ATCC 15444]|uniref:2,5-dichloro-2,5-cyclohexadiene-1,4-diol dehydrogenase LinC n=2 Tax=Hyphomonas TaxID=85 RepID=Q0C292_HYPNA|nr:MULTISPECIES: SDR family oxidoreductase [Hyphomonas]ABI75397.1 2,5-dichloro-2,5-cyclohexadiene-1,4-diol dehydrogenase LinC [Hyphomonas neptunium ATCC 15444]KCZ93137.1 short chain dehydrogenase [Hyphomonas hirschiana VP5]
MLLNGKTIIITGASSGIGAAAARIFAAEGANVVLGARRAELLEQITKDISAHRGEAVFLAGDVEDSAYAADLVKLAESRFGGLDGAFNNAGVTGDMGPIPDMAESNWHKVIAVNLNSGFYAAKHQIPAMRKRGGGSIVFTSSFVGHTIGLPGMGAYAAAKAGLIGITQVLAAEHGPENIRVNALLPGGTMTPMAGDDADFHEVVRGFHALKRMAEPSEIANAALFLLSDHASFVTGSAMIADGGNSISKL